MKSLLILAIVLAITSSKIYPLNVANECSFQSCQESKWKQNNLIYSYKCPRSGEFSAKFISERGAYAFNFTSQSPQPTYCSIPLNYVQNATSNGLQYYAGLDQGHFFVILNCTIPTSRNYSSLCNRHQFVGGKIINNTFQNSCAFGLDIPRQDFLQKEMPLEFEAQF